MPFLIQLLWAIVISAVSRYFFAPEVGGGSAAPAALSDVDAPTISEGTTIPVVIGSVLTGRQNVTWYGGLSNSPITRSGVTTGYKYSLTVQSSLCFGPVDSIREIRFDDVVAAQAGDAVTNAADYWDFNINKPDLFGGEEKEGGVVGLMRIYKGTTTQNADTELNTLMGAGAPAFRRVCHAVMRNMYVGTSPRIKSPSFLVERCPRSLVDQWGAEVGGNYDGYQIHRIGSNIDANPICAIYEALTDTIWGAAVPRDQLHTAEWWNAAVTIKIEGLGVSTVLGSGDTADALVKRLAQYVDALVYDDPVTGKITIQLVRDIGTYLAPQLSEQNVSAVNTSRISWTELKTTTKVTYTDASRNFETGGVMAQNSAVVEALGGAVDTEVIDLPGFSGSTPALSTATRLLRSLSYPLSKVEIEGDRSLASVRPGAPFHLEWERPSISAYYRATEVDLGSPANPFVKITAIEDIFTAASNTFTPPPGSEFSNQGALAQPASRLIALETPYHLRRNGLRNAIFGVAAPSADHIGYHVIVNGSTADAATYGWMTSGALSVAIPRWDGETLASITLSVSVPASMTSPTPGQYDAGESLLLIESELLAYRTLTRNSNGTVTFGDVARAVLDTVPAAHGVGALCVVLSTCSTRLSLDLTTDASVTLAAQTMTLADTQAILAASSRTLMTQSRAVRPYPPALVSLVGTAWGASGAFVSPTLTWLPRSRAQTTVLSQTASSVTAESGTDYVVRLYDATSGALVDTIVTTGLSATLTALGDYTVRVNSRRDGLLSLQGYVGSVTVQEASLSVPTTMSVSETAGTAVITVTLAPASPSTVTVAYATADGSATAGADYAATSGTLTFTAGQTTRTITVPLTDDTAVEGGETFTVTLSSPTGATLGNAVTTVTATSDDVSTGDDHFADVKLLLHANGTAGSTTFADSSPSARSPSSVDGVTLLAGGQFGTGLGRASGATEAKLLYAATTDFDLSTPWTLEFSILIPVGMETRNFMGLQADFIDLGGGPRFQWAGPQTSLPGLHFIYGSDVYMATGWSPGGWNRVAITQDATNLRAFLNGTLLYTGGKVSGAPAARALNVCRISPSWAGPVLDVGVILDEIRFTRFCRYTAAYTPTTVPFPDSAT